MPKARKVRKYKGDVSPFSQLHRRRRSDNRSPSPEAEPAPSQEKTEQSSKSQRESGAKSPSRLDESRSKPKSSRETPSTSSEVRQQAFQSGTETQAVSVRASFASSGQEESTCFATEYYGTKESVNSWRTWTRIDASTRAGLEYLQTHPPAPGSHPLGPQYCVDCAETPPHLTVEECIVYQYLKKILTSPHWQYPCISCSSVSHTTNACLFTHSRCTKCGFLGHKAFECHLRTPEQWLAAYLLVAHLGRGTRANPLGPIEGKWGFGNTSKLNLTYALRRLIHAKRIGFKAIHDKGTEEIDQEAELRASWMVLIEEQQRHQDRTRKDAFEYQEALARRVADILQERAARAGQRPSWCGPSVPLPRMADLCPL